MIINNLDSLCFQAWTGCVSSCSGCLRQFWSREKDFGQLLKNIKTVVQKKIFSGNILIYNIDFFAFSEQEIALFQDFQPFFKKVSFHTESPTFNIPFDNPNTSFIYQKNFTMTEIQKVVNFLKSDIKNHTLFAYWCKNFEWAIKMIKILKYNKACILSINTGQNSIEICLQNCSIKFLLMEPERSNINSCFFLKVLIGRVMRFFLTGISILIT